LLVEEPFYRSSIGFFVAFFSSPHSGAALEGRGLL